MVGRPNCLSRGADECAMRNAQISVRRFSQYGCALGVAFVAVAAVAAAPSRGWANEGVSSPLTSVERRVDASHLRQRAAEGDRDAMFKLGLMYATGRGVNEDDAEAIRWYEEAARAGHAAAMNNLAGHHARGEGVARSETKAVEWLTRAADAGHPRAKSALAARMLHGAGVPKDEVRSHQLASEAAESGDSAAMLLVARAYTLGRGTERNETLAARWIARAAKTGDARAMASYGAILAEGRGVAPDAKEAFYWHRAGALAGDATAMANLALAYLDGDGVAIDRAEGHRWLLAAAEAGDSIAMVALGDMHAGRLPKWTAHSFASADPNEPRVQNATSTVSPCTIDHAKAVEWYTRAAEAGHPGALTSLAVHHADGLGVEVDEERAVALLTVAAEAGVAEAMLNLSGLLRDGRGAEVSPADAYFWALNGARLVDGDRRIGARRYAASIGEALTPVERDDVLARSDRFVDAQEIKLAHSHPETSRRTHAHRNTRSVAALMRKAASDEQFATGAHAEPRDASNDPE